MVSDVSPLAVSSSISSARNSNYLSPPQFERKVRDYSRNILYVLVIWDFGIWAKVSAKTCRPVSANWIRVINDFVITQQQCTIDGMVERGGLGVEWGVRGEWRPLYKAHHNTTSMCMWYTRWSNFRCLSRWWNSWEWRRKLYIVLTDCKVPVRFLWHFDTNRSLILLLVLQGNDIGWTYFHNLRYDNIPLLSHRVSHIISWITVTKVFAITETALQLLNCLLLTRH